MMNLNADFYFQLEASAGPLYQAIGEVAQKLPEHVVELLRALREDWEV